MKRLTFFLFLSFGLVSCDEDTVNTILDLFSRPSEADVTTALQQALEVGAGNSVDILSATDGYFQDQAVKILLPDEAQSAIDAVEASSNPIVTVPYEALVKPVINDLILSLNRSAEDAAGLAFPIFRDAIFNMTITDAFNILQGSETAATDFLRANTSTQLVGAFSPIINTSLDKDLVGGTSTNQIWGTFTTEYNNVSSLSFGALPAIEETNLGEYVTARALDGLFLKVSDEERKIREDPLARVSELLENVFGWLDQQN